MDTNTKKRLLTKQDLLAVLMVVMSLIMFACSLIMLANSQDSSTSNISIDAVATAEGDTVISGVTGVFTEIGDWIVTSLGNVVELFYDATANEFTFLGILAIAGLAVSVFFLIMGVVQNFLHFRS